MTADLAYAGLAELGSRLKRRELSPVELCRALLERCQRLEPHLNAFVTLTPERILADAHTAEQELAGGRWRGPLHGVPVAVKDLFWTRGERTTSGSRVFADFIPTEDATVVARLREAGAIVFGKTNTPELAYGPVEHYHYGPTRNPWDLGRYAGGSSMGSAAAVAAGLVPGAVGTDTGGSIRYPAHWCGITGLKPTYGRVPLRGVVALARSLDHAGPMARSAHDCALLLAAIAGYDPDDATTADVPVPNLEAALTTAVRGLRVGVPREGFWNDLPDAIAQAADTALHDLQRLGLELQEVALPEWRDGSAAIDVLIRCEAAAEHRGLLADHADELLPEVRERLAQGLATPAPDYVDAARAAMRLRAALARIGRQVDLLALPARDRTAPRIDPAGRLLDKPVARDFASGFNLAGVPALSIPCGFDDEGLPIGLQLAGRAWEEGTLLRVAHAYQQVTDWHARHPSSEVPSPIRSGT